MRTRRSFRLLTVAFLGVARAASAQPAEQSPPRPPALRLPAGVTVRVWTRSLPGQRIDGVLRGSEPGALRLVPTGADPLAPGELTLPLEDVERLQLGLSKKSHWWQGLLMGVAVGVLAGLTDDVDPVLCKVNENVECSRGAAVATYAGGFGLLGLGVGALVRTQRWTPVAVDALEPFPARTSRAAPGLQLTVRF